jgi:ketosteroid isomerase-like protein
MSADQLYWVLAALLKRALESKRARPHGPSDSSRHFCEESSMKIENSPITGNEDKQRLSPQLRALSGFYTAFNNADLELMSKNWAQTDEAIMDNPVGGIMRGWADIRSVYEKIFRGPAKVQVEFYDYTLHDSEGMFYVVGRERGELRSDRIRLDLAIRTTRIFRLVDGQWRQVHHHGSMDNPELLATYQAAVRGD